MKIKTILCLLLLSFSQISYSQKDTSKNNKHYIQFTGIVVTSDSIQPIPFASISVRNKPYGDYSDFNGKFSVIAEKGDTIVFSHVQFKKSFFIVPDTLPEFKYHIIHAMTADTIYLDGTIVTPVPNRATFDQYFLTVELPQEKLDIARKNLEREELKEQAMKMGMDEKENYAAFMRQQNTYQYQRGMAPTITLMDPFAWARFFEAWKRGDFKKNPMKANDKK